MIGVAGKVTMVAVVSLLLLMFPACALSEDVTIAAPIASDHELQHQGQQQLGTVQYDPDDPIKPMDDFSFQLEGMSDDNDMQRMSSSLTDEGNSYEPLTPNMETTQGVEHRTEPVTEPNVMVVIPPPAHEEHQAAFNSPTLTTTSYNNQHRDDANTHVIGELDADAAVDDTRDDAARLYAQQPHHRDVVVSGDGRQQKSVFSQVGDPPSARISVRLEPYDFFCVHQKFKHGDTVDVYFNVAPDSYGRNFSVEFTVIENLPKTKTSSRVAEAPAKVVVYKEASRRHGLFSLTVKPRRFVKASDSVTLELEQPHPDGDGVRRDKQNVVVYDFCFDVSHSPSSSVATLALTKTSNDDFKVLEALVKRQFSLITAARNSSYDPRSLEKALNAILLDAVNDGGDTDDADRRDALARSTMKLVREKLRICLTQLRQLSDVEHASRRQAEENFTLVNSWSAMQVLTMLLASVLQVVTVKSLFDERSRIRAVFRTLFSHYDVHDFTTMNR